MKPGIRRRAVGALAALILGPALAAPSPALPPDWYPESVAVGPDGTMYAGSWAANHSVSFSAVGRSACDTA